MNLENVNKWEMTILNGLSSLEKEEVNKKINDDNFFVDSFNMLKTLFNLPDLNDEEKKQS